MGIALETSVFFATNPTTAGAAATMATGDTNRIRSFASTAQAKLLEVYRQGATEGFVQVASPLFHDPVRGIRLITTETPYRWPLPPEIGQPLAPTDTLAFTIAGGTSETDAGAILVGYSDISGVNARLHSWGDISSSVLNIKPLEVDFSTNASTSQWQDTVITTTEDLLHADRSYAVLGYYTDTAVLCVGLRGQETGNLRIAGPGVVASDITNDFFVETSNRSGMPCIPVISANNKGSIFLSCAAVATATAVKAGLILAELSQSFTG